MLIAKTLSTNSSIKKNKRTNVRKKIWSFFRFFFYEDKVTNINMVMFGAHNTHKLKEKKTFKSHNKLLPLNIKYLSIQRNEFGVRIIIIITEWKTQEIRGTSCTTSKKIYELLLNCSIIRSSSSAVTSCYMCYMLCSCTRQNSLILHIF